MITLSRMHSILHNPNNPLKWKGNINIYPQHCWEVEQCLLIHFVCRLIYLDPTPFHVKRWCFVVSFLLFNYVFKLFWTKVFLPWYFIHERRNKIVLSAVPRLVCLYLSVWRGLGTRREFEWLDGKNHTFKKLFQVLYFCTFKPQFIY